MTRPTWSFLIACWVSTAAYGQFNDPWATFIKDNTHLGPAPTAVSDINNETDLAWGDVNLDGWIDLVVVKKQPFTTAGKRRNMLLVNQNGVLTDRTSTHASASDVAGDNGLLTPTNDRDVLLEDLDGDCYPEVVTAVDVSDGDPKHVCHPRVYKNLANDVSGVWLGFQYQDARIPQLLHNASGNPVFPRFTSVAAGDVTGDGSPDLYFGDQDTGSPSQGAAGDSDDRLLINDGNGFFTDQSTLRMTATMLKSNFCASVAIADFNQDGANDILKQSTYNTPTRVYIAYNDPANVGQFLSYDQAQSGSPYFVSSGDLNNDGRPDVVVSDNGADKFMINTGNEASPPFDATWQVQTFNFLSGGDDGFGSNNLVTDIDDDGWNDVLICDVDVELTGYNRRLHVYHNRKGTVGGTDVVLREERENTTATGWIGAVGLTTTDLQGTHDVAVFDVDGDGQKDLVISRKDGTDVWQNTTEVCHPNLGFGVGLSRLKVCGGNLATGNDAVLTLADAPQNAFALLFVGIAANPTFVYDIQGSLVPVPWLFALPLSTNAQGRIVLPVPGGNGPATAVIQFVVQHDKGPRPSNAVQLDFLP